MVYGYARCSTSEDKQDINIQIKKLKEMGGKKRENIYFEYGSGVKVDRVELKKMFNQVKPKDTVMVTEVSRITRSTKQLCEVIELAKLCSVSRQTMIKYIQIYEDKK